MAEDGGKVNLFRDLDVLMEVPRSIEGESGADRAQGQERRHLKKGFQKKKAVGGDRRGRGQGAAKEITSGPRPSLKDPDLYMALMKECSREEQMDPGQEYMAPPLVVNYLVRNDVRPLKKRSVKFPKAQYYCRLCDYHCDTLTICISHIKDERHSRLARMQEIETTLYHLPKPSKQHLDHLEGLLNRVRGDQGILPKDLRARDEAAKRVDAFMKTAVNGSSVRLYGSSMTGFGLQNSTLNLDLQIPEEMAQHLALIAASNSLAENQECTDVVRDFSAKIPKIIFKLLPSPSCGGVGPTFECELSLNNQLAFQTSVLLRDYFSLDPRVPVLATAIRYWAQLCSVDRQAEGTLPAHAFAILLVFFLQQTTKPVLPCLHDDLEARNTESYQSPTVAMQRWKTRNSMSVAELLIEFFEFYALGFRVADFVVSIRNVGGFSKNDKQWKGKKLAIEDPFSPKRNLTRSVSGLSTLDYINDCFKIAYLYFGTIQTTEGPVITRILVPDASPERRQSPIAAQEEAENDKVPEGVGQLLEQLKIQPSELEGASGGAAIKDKLPSDKVITLEELEKSFNNSNEVEGGEDSDDETSEDEESDNFKSMETLESFMKKYGRELTPKQAKRVTELVPKNKICFQFVSDILTAGHSPTLVCSVCNAEGHLQHACPEEEMPPARPLHPLPGFAVEILNRVCMEVQNIHQPSINELRERDQFMRDLSRFIKKSTPKAVLTVFGSSHNGFAFAHSDLDISMTLEDHETDEGIDAIELIERLAEKLKRMNGIRNVQAITSAKVPIIKFISIQYQPRIEGDISLYNILAQENTKMLRCYSNIDLRVKVLGYVVKKFAKSCDIGDASRGSLSSYAYILMLIHFLQQRKPPVVPVLQELHTPGQRPTKMVDGWDAWFFDDMDKLGKMWPGLGCNKESITELWLGFLQYYSVDFDDKNLVVCTRQLKPLTKFEKMWNSPCIAIEDPFELSHNLGAGISRKMNVYIKKCFLKTRDRFAFPPDGMASAKFNEIWNYLWDPEHLCDGPPPNDRGCRACGKIGHLVRDCPRRRAHEESHNRKQREKNIENHRKMAGEVAAAMGHKLNQQHLHQQQLLQQQQHRQPQSPGGPHTPGAVRFFGPPLVAAPTAGSNNPDLAPALMSMLAGAAAAAAQQQQQHAPQPPGFAPGLTPQRGPAAPQLPSSAISLSDLERSFTEAPSARIQPAGQQRTAPPGIPTQPATESIRQQVLPQNEPPSEPAIARPSCVPGPPPLETMSPPEQQQSATWGGMLGLIPPQLPLSQAFGGAGVLQGPPAPTQPAQSLSHQQLFGAGGAFGPLSFGSLPPIPPSAQLPPMPPLQQQQQPLRHQAPPHPAFPLSAASSSSSIRSQEPVEATRRPLQLNDMPQLNLARLNSHQFQREQQQHPQPSTVSSTSSSSISSNPSVVSGSIEPSPNNMYIRRF